MNLRTALFVVPVIWVLAGCGSSNTHVLGVWEGKIKGAPVTVTLNADSSYSAKSDHDLAHGRWTSTDTSVELFHDVRESKGSALGDSQSATMKYSQVEETLTLPIPNDSPIIFRRSKS